MPAEKNGNPLTDILWVEKYRPTSLKDLALSTENRALMTAYLEGGEVPHLLLVGPPGVGKTTLGRIIYHTIDCKYLVLNASEERGIDVVRRKIGGFVTAMTDARYHIVFLDEADGMSADAQNSLRNLIESYADRSRFILTANKLHRIIGPLQSRCQLLTLTTPPLKERYRVLAGVLEAEQISADVKTVLGYAERYPDLRKMLMNTQRAYLTHGELVPATEEHAADGTSILALLEQGNWVGLRHITTSDGFDPSQGLRDLFYAVPDDHRKCSFLRQIIGKAIHDCGFTPDPVILFLGTCAEAMEGLTQ